MQYYVLTGDNILLAVLQILEKTNSDVQTKFHLSSNHVNSLPTAPVPVVHQPTEYDVTCVQKIQEKLLLIDIGTQTKYVVRFPSNILLD